MPNTKQVLRAGGVGAVKTNSGTLPMWLIEHFRGAGDPGSAYDESATLYRALEIRMNTVAGGELKLFAKDGTEIEEHELLDVLHNVNAEWNYSDLWRYTDAGRMVHGFGAWQKVRAGGDGYVPGPVRELFYLNPTTIRVKTGPRGIDGFTQRVQGQGEQTFAREDVVYFRGAYDPRNDLLGRSPLKWAINAAFGEGATERYLSAFFKNGAVPALIFSTDQPMEDGEIEKAKTWWDRLFAGVVNQFKTGFLGGGLKPYTVGSSIKDMELSSVRAELRRTICEVVGVPELLISSTDAADLTPVDLAMKVLYYTTVIPAWKWYAEVLNAELLSEYDDLVGQGCYLAFDTDDIEVLQEDATSKTARLVSLVAGKIIKPEVAALELGYEEADVPEPEPVPAALAVDPVTGQPMPAKKPVQADAPTERQPAESTAQRSVATRDMDRWQRKALNALERGKPPAVPFASDAIAASEHERISAALGEAKTADEVRAVFTPAEQDTFAAAVAELRRFNNLQESAGAS